MAAFTAKDVQALREKTGVGMMDCKKALVESDGDMEKAIDFLREKGLAAATKKAGRIAAEGVVLAYNNEEKKIGVVVEVNSETDFVAKNQEFQSFVLDIAKTIAASNPADVDALLAEKLAGSERTVQENLQDKILAIGENMKIRRFERVEGVVSTYVHGGGTVGVMVHFDADDATAANEKFKAMGKDVAMQIAAMNPAYLDEASVPADVIAHEKEILTAQLAEDEKNKNKPAQVIEKIVQGRIGKYYKENCLMDQQFVKDGDLSVGKYVESVAKEIGASVKVLGFTRFAKGEGLQKREDNFADEVARHDEISWFYSKKIPPGFIPGGIFAVVGAAKPAVAWAKSRANGLSLPFLFVGRRRAVCRADLLIDFRGKLWFPLIGIESVLLLLHIIELCVAERTDMGVIH